MKIYICGPMTNIPEFNFPEFHRVAALLRKQKHLVVNPAELDEAEGTKQSWDFYLRRDLKKMVDCEVIAALKGWQKSKGANLEVHVAQALGMAILDAYTLEPIQETVLEEAQRIVMGDRGAAYGNPRSDFTRTGKIWEAILGIPVSAEQVGLCMVGVKLSRQTNKPKRDNLVDIAGYALCSQMLEAN